MIKAINIHTLWERLTRELASVFDLHGVCAAIASEVAAFADTLTVVALNEPNGRYYDVWLCHPDGTLEQMRWEGDKVNFHRLLSDDQSAFHQKHAQPAGVLINDELWLVPKESLLIAPLPYPRDLTPVMTDGVLCLIDPSTDCPLTVENLADTTLYLTTFLERAALRQQRDRQEIEFAIISDISHSLASTLKLEDIFARVADDVRRMLDVESLSLGLIDQVTGNIVFIPELMGSLFLEIPPIELRPGEGIAGWVAMHGKPVIVNDAYSDKRFFAKSDRVSGFHTRSILCIPLTSDERVIGVMEAINKQNGDFNQHDHDLLNALSGPLAAAIINARLHQDVVSEKRRIETIFQSMSEGMLTVNTDGYITATNDAMLTLLQREQDDITGHLATKVIRLKDGDFSEFIAEVILASDEGHEFPQLACEIKQNGSYVPVLAGGAPVQDEDGKVEEAVLAFSDLRQIREVERMRDDFFHNIVHELRTPLALILMYARLLLNGRAQDDPEKANRFLKTIEQESDRLQTMVRQMLQLSKLEAKEIQRSSERVKLNDILDEMLPPLADKATEKGLTFIQRVKPELPDIIADRDTIYMIFKNLIDNAIKFTLSGSVKVDARAENERILVEVSDDGIGIPEAAMPNLFKRFYRTQTAVERGIAGTGIGLYMVKEGVEKHGGTLTVQSAEGDGTTFVVNLPIAK